MTDFGSDISTFPDLDANFAPITGRRVVTEAVLRRLTTPRGALLGAPDYGLDLRGWLNRSVRPGDLARLQADIEAEVEKDERIYSATATCMFTQSTSTLIVQVACDLADGPFTLVVGLSGAATAAVVTMPQYEVIVKPAIDAPIDLIPGVLGSALGFSL